MANSFFEFDTSLKEGLDLKNGENLLPDEDDDGYENEEEYDALNDETFGCDPSNLEDWEQQHEQFAEINESSRHTDKIQNSLSQLVVDDSSDEEPSAELLTFPKDSSVWAYTPTQKNGDIYNNSVLSSLQKASKSFIESHTNNSAFSNLSNQLNDSIPLNFSSRPGKICTVEELEKNLIRNSQQSAQAQPQQQLQVTPGFPGQQNQMPPNPISLQQVQGQQRPFVALPGHTAPPPYHHILQHPNTRLPPPGLPPINIPPPPLRHLPPPLNAHHPLMPAAFRMIPPHPQLIPPNGTSRPPGFMYPMVNHPFNFPPPPPNNMAQPVPPQNKGPLARQPPQQQYSPQRQQHQPNQRIRNTKDQQEDENKDEYAGLMTAKDKQWLLNIQMIQLNTGTPYFDDYYYTIYKERKSRNHIAQSEKNGRFHNNGRQRRNSERQENNLTPRVYTPLQFENSLGKLQCGSVTAPRKIIDMDIVTPDKDQDMPPPTKDSRKTKQLLLELEASYSLLLRAEDIKNPMFISNMEKWREMKQKQRLRELEQAPTPEQKQEVLRLFKLESEPIVENQYEYIVKIVNGLLQDDKFSSFLNIRKGKMLLLRLLPHLTSDLFAPQLLEIWSKALLSLPIIGRRDTAGDNILPKLYPYFKRYVQNCTMSDVLEITSGLVEVVRQENNRSTPLSHVGKVPLYFVVLNKFGVSALVYLFIRTECVFSTEKPSDREREQWSEFLISWAKQAEMVSKVAVPLEPIPTQFFKKHVSRFANVPAEKMAVLEKHFVDIQIIS